MNIGIYERRTGTAASGGTETFLRRCMRALSERHDVTLYTGAGDLLDEVAAMDVDVVQVGHLEKSHRVTATLSSLTPVKSAEVGSLSMYLAARRDGLFERMAADQDVVSTHYYLDNLLVSRTVDLPTLFRFPGIKQPSPRWAAMVKYARPALYVANSESTRRRLEAWYDVDVAGVVYAGVAADRFLDAGSDTGSAGVTVLFVGRLDEGKGLFDLLEAVEGLDREDVRLRVVGDGELAADFRSAVEARGLGDRVELAGPVPNDRIHEAYAAADVFCLPSHHESHGIVNVEAMLSGLPVVSTRIDAIEEYVVDGENGLLVDPGDTAALEAALARLADDPGLRTRLGEAGRETARRYTVEATASAMENMYKRAIDMGGTDERRE